MPKVSVLLELVRSNSTESSEVAIDVITGYTWLRTFSSKVQLAVESSWAFPQGSKYKENKR